MKRNKTPEIIAGIAGTKVARVPLAGGKGHALIDQADYAALIKSGHSAAWFYSPAAPTRSYVCVKRGVGPIPVARLIVGARKGQVVQYRDGDRLNLQRSNLRLVSGPARSNCPDLATAIQ